MSTFITAAFVEQFSANVQMLEQQKTSRLSDKVRNEELVGNTGWFEQVEPTSAKKRTSRHADTPQIDTLHKARQVNGSTYDWSDLIDKPDRARTLIDIESTYVKNGVMALFRAADDEIIVAATGPAIQDKDLPSPVSLPASQILPVTLGALSGFTNAGMNLEKLQEAKFLMDANEVDP